MSTVVVVNKNNQACIAADTLSTLGDLKQSSMYDLTAEKILCYKDNYIGIVGSSAHDVVIRSLLADEKAQYDFGSRMAIFESFRAMHKILKKRYYLNVNGGDEQQQPIPYEPNYIDALIVNRHGIFGAFSLREVCVYSKYWAIGSGAEIALGAMYACYDAAPNAAAIARIAIEASAEFNITTALPMSVYTLSLDTISRDQP